jgi:small subunit ribosomal protein S5
MAANNLNRVKSTETELKDKLVSVNRVTKVTKGGRTFSFSAIVVVGDENGIVGHGLGKAKEVTEAITKGIDDAKKNLIRVPILRGTVPHAQKGKFGGAEVLLKPATPGTGVIAGGSVRTVLELAGVKNILAKQFGSNNILNNAKATILALTNLNEKVELGKYQSSHKQMFYDKIMRKYKNVRIVN